MQATDRTTRQFLIFAGGFAEEILDEGAATENWSAPDVYDELVLAGYPLCADASPTFDGCIDVVTDGVSVIAQTNGLAPNEHDLGPVAEVFLSWLSALEHSHG